jgi:hypothetical protein
VNGLLIETPKHKEHFLPGQEISGRVSWTVERTPDKIELRLFWFTDSDGANDVGIVDRIVIEQPSNLGSREFSFTLPQGPYSFEGKHTSLFWALEAVALPSKEFFRLLFTLSPTGDTIVLNA